MTASSDAPRDDSFTRELRELAARDARGDSADEVALAVPARVEHLRTIRLVAAEAGRRAGLDASEIDDLRIAVDELCHALMEQATRRLVVRVVVVGTCIIVRGSTRVVEAPTRPQLSRLAELIVDAISDEYSFSSSESETSFVLVKHARDRR